MSFETDRTGIKGCLTTAGVQEISTQEFELPEYPDEEQSYPFAQVLHTKKVGSDASLRQYHTFGHEFTVAVVVRCEDNDPDLQLENVCQAFREAYKTTFHKDIETIEFYNGKIKGTIDVRIAKMQVWGK